MKHKQPLHRRMNFMPADMRPSAFGPASLSLLMLACLIGLPLAGVGASGARWIAEKQLAEVGKEQEQLSAQITAGIQSRDSSADQLAATAIKKALSEKLYWADVFKELSNVAPKSVWLSSFDTSVDAGVKKVAISGHGTSQVEIAEFFARLEGSYFFRDVQLKFTETSDATGDAPFRFQFEGKVFDSGKDGKDGPT